MKKKTGAGAGKKFAGSPALVFMVKKKLFWQFYPSSLPNLTKGKEPELFFLTLAAGAARKQISGSQELETEPAKKFAGSTAQIYDN